MLPTEIGVNAGLPHELAVNPTLDNSAILHDQDLVGLGYGRQPVRDGDHRSSDQSALQGFLKLNLGSRIEMRGRLVEDHQVRRFEK